ncbi:MAG: hypothetical protein JKY99_09225 [Rhizobiales bacterium]|nr:hypothetical protein [Hyphomicrobiales bacterium]
MEFLKDRHWRKTVIKDAFGRSFFGFLLFAVIAGVFCWWFKGPEIFFDTINGDIDLILRSLPRIAVALSIAGLIWVMLPRDRVSALVGENSGMKGLLVATLAGTITPGGPSSAYALLGVLAVSGADRGALIAYITAWATLGMQRILLWDVPFMGEEFAIFRFIVGMPLPVIAGLIARALPLTLKIVDTATDTKP